MGALNTYLQDTQRLIRDQGQKLINPEDLTRYVNLARREVAMRSGCVRRLTPISGAITGASVSFGGVSYGSNISITLSAPDFPNGLAPTPLGAQASASATIINGSVADVQIDYGGSGYFQPQLIITDQTSGYSAASIALQTSWFNVLNQGQEVYNFRDIDLSMFPGVESVISVRSLSIIYSNYRYSLPVYSFSTYQAMIRQYPFQYQWVPTFGAQYMPGADGSFYLYPLPNDTYQVEWDCMCLPSDLVTDLSVETIPQPWNDSIQFMAAQFAYLEMQNFNYARAMEAEFDKWVTRKSQFARPGRWSNPYGRY